MALAWFEAAPSPAAFTARTSKVYAVPLSRPSTVRGVLVALRMMVVLPAMSAQSGSQLSPPSSLCRYWKPVRGLPPSESGATQASTA